MRFCVIVPAFDAEPHIGAVLEELRGEFAELAPDDVIVVDDGSRDGTAAAARAAGARVVAHAVNRGKGAALVTGLRAALAAGHEAALTVDADAQHPARSARLVLDGSRDAGDFVLGVRDLARDGAPRASRFSNGISNVFLSLFTGRALADTQCGLRRYPVRRTLELAPRAAGYAFEAEVILLAAAAGVPIVEVAVPVRYPAPEERLTHFDSVRDPAKIIGVVLRTVVSTRLRRPRVPSVQRPGPP